MKKLSVNIKKIAAVAIAIMMAMTIFQVFGDEGNTEEESITSVITYYTDDYDNPNDDDNNISDTEDDDDDDTNDTDEESNDDSGIEPGECDENCECEEIINLEEYDIPVQAEDIAELKSAIQAAEESGQPAIIALTSPITIPAGDSVEIESQVPVALTVNSDYRHFVVQSGGSLILGGGITLTAQDEAGGGVHADGGEFIMNGGAISGNTMISGGGVHVDNNGIFTMNGGIISDNTAIGKDNAHGGGGVNIGGEALNTRGTFIMTNGTISGNSANNGGGVHVLNGSFTMTGGEIMGNSAILGHGVAVRDYSDTINGEITLGGTAKIQGNKSPGSEEEANVLLEVRPTSPGTHRVITLSAENPPTCGMVVGVTKIVDSANRGVIVNEGATAEHLSYFKSDAVDWKVACP